MGKLAKKDRNFAKKNLSSVLKQRRKNKVVFKKRPSQKDKKDVAEKEVVKTVELSNERDFDKEVAMNTSLDALFAEDDNATVASDDSDSDGYLSEDPSCENILENDNDVILEDDRVKKSTMSINNQKVYKELAEQKKSLDKLKKKDQKFVKFLESYSKGELSQDQKMYPDEDEDLMLLDDSETTKHKVLTFSVINSWSKLVAEEQNGSVLISLLNAYRSVCHLGSEESGPRVQDSEIFCKIFTIHAF